MSHFRVTPDGVLVPFSPHIIKRAYAEFEARGGVGMEGLYRLQVRRADGSLKRDTGWFKNLILDGGLNRMGTAGVGSHCVVGTGATPPATTDGALQSLQASTTTVQSTTIANSGAPDYYISHTRTYRFAIGALNGNYSEVGIGWGTATLFSRALIVDGGGSPQPITVLSDEQLDVIYQLRTYMPLTDWGGTYTIGGASTTVVGRRFNAGNTNPNSTAGVLDVSLRPTNTGAQAFSNSTLSATTGTGPSGTQVALLTSAASATWTDDAYSNGSNTRTSRMIVGLNYGNIAGGIGAVAVYGPFAGHSFEVQYGFTPKIAKDSTKTLTLVMGISWARRP